MDAAKLFKAVIRHFYPPDYYAYVTLATVIFLSQYPNHLKTLFNKYTFAVTAVLFCCLMQSGLMYVLLEGQPYYKVQGDGDTEYVHTYMREQWGVEVNIVCALNIAIVLGMILMIEAAGGVYDDDSGPRVPLYGNAKGLRTLQSAVGLAIVCGFFSLLLHVFCIKKWGYPYRLLI